MANSAGMMAGMAEKRPILDYEPGRPSVLRFVPGWLRRALLVIALVVAGEALLVGSTHLLFGH
jgi:hypothetical protein